MIEYFLWWVAKKVGSMVFVRVSVCPSILAPGARTDGLNGTGEAPFDAPEPRKDDGANRRAISAKWHVPSTNVPSSAKNI